MNTSKELEVASRNHHAMAGLIAVLVPAYFWGSHSLVWSFPMVLVVCFEREFCHYYKHGMTEPRGNSLLDFLGYLAGALFGVILIIIKSSHFNP